MEYPIGKYLDDYTLLDKPGVSAQLTDMVRIYPWFTLGRYMHLRSLQGIDSVSYNRAARQLDVRLFAHPYPRILLEEEESADFARKSLQESTYHIAQEIPYNISQESTYHIAQEIPYNISQESTYHTSPENVYATDVYYTELPQQDTVDLIDGFLNRNDTGRIIPQPIPTMGTDHRYYEQEDISVESVTEDGQIASETLAQIYLEQGFPERAIEIYYALSLKYPEKSVFFANLIADLRAQRSNW